MALVKKIAKLIAATLFSTFLSFFILLISLHDLTSYETLKSLSRNQLGEHVKQLEDACKNFPNSEFNVQNENFSCNQIKDLETFAAKMFDQTYYKNYSCSIAECIKQPSAFFSSFGYKLVSDVLYISGIMAVLFGMILFILLEQRIKGLGISLLFVGTNYFVLMALKITMSTQIAAAGSIINSILDPLMTNFLYVLIAGIVLTAIGFHFKK